jgi:hypothetical protein
VTVQSAPSHTHPITTPTYEADPTTWYHISILYLTTMTTRRLQPWTIALVVLFIQTLGLGERCAAFSVKKHTTCEESSSLKTTTMESSRRSFFTSIGTSTTAALITAASLPSVAQAGIDPSLLKNIPVQGDESGTAQRLRQIEAAQRPSSDLIDIPFEELPSGVSFREYRAGKGEAGEYFVTQTRSDTHRTFIQFFLSSFFASPNPHIAPCNSRPRGIQGRS